MIEIKYSRSKLSLIINGHANYAPAGQDIVCAGVSALLYSVPAALRTRGFKYYVDVDELAGCAIVQAIPAAEERHTCIVIFDTAYAGMKLLAEHYPEHIKLITKEAI